MDRARPTGKLLDWKPMGTRPVGRPRQRWQEDVMEDLEKLKVKNWKEAAKDRRTLRDLAEKGKTHKGLYSQMMMMMMMISPPHPRKQIWNFSLQLKATHKHHYAILQILPSINASH